MFNVTDRRLAKAKPILEEFRERLNSGEHINTHHLEMRLRACWNKGYRTIKDAMVSLFKSRPRYRKLAAYYMQFLYCGWPAQEHKRYLAEFYRVRFYDSLSREAIQEFWAKQR